jgi:transposase-like protein
VLTDIRNRGTTDVCIVVCDGLKGLPDAVAAVWPKTVVQTCIVHYPDLAVMPTWMAFVLVEESLALGMSA